MTRPRRMHASVRTGVKACRSGRARQGAPASTLMDLGKQRLAAQRQIAFVQKNVHQAPSFQFVPWKHKKDNPRDDDTWERKSLHELLVAGDVDFGARRAKSLWSNRLMLP